jgi:N-dimethylarginine dimethylaminohydrolase
MVAAYEEAGVTVHFLEPDRALPYQVFARDSSAMTPSGAVITQVQQWWRRGEYAPALRFYQSNQVPIRGMITAGALEGGDVMILEPGCAVIGAGEARTQEPAARQLAGWLAGEGWEVRVEPIPERFVHMDVLLGVLAERLVAACTDVLAANFVAWLRSRGFDLIEVSSQDAFELGANAISLGGERVLSTASAGPLNAAMRALGLRVEEVDLSMFTLGGGGPHCLVQALRRRRLGG